ncbi:MAG TPA: UdgX family uracil-DNA binding protein [Gammaproteobacteria bacterium]|nr:UdgX family uracil-DNA binding protein [Gammaproteobacteria bacterium]
MTKESDISAADFMPAQRSMKALKTAAASCRGCDLYRAATQTVFGEGLKRSRLMLVGEMPGDKEDLAGRPFVGPAGQLLDEALKEAGIDRTNTYITNVVKHFKWEPRGRRRLHKTPNRREIGACLPWLEAEIALVKPEVFVCLGATAAKALLGPDFRVSDQHGRFVTSDWADFTLATAHPSAVLRMRDHESRERARRQLTADLATVAKVL